MGKTNINDKIKQVSQMERNNRLAIFGHGLECLIIAIAYWAEVFKGDRTVLYALMTTIIGLTPVVLELIAFSRNKESRYVLKILGYGFALFYMFILFTANINLVFVYAFPMYMIISVYSDTKFSLKVCVGATILNLIMEIVAGTKGILDWRGMAAAEIQVFVMVMISLFGYLSAKTIRLNEKDNLDEVSVQKQRSEQLLQNAMEVSGGMSEGIDRIHEKIRVLEEAAATTQEAMGEVLKGSTETADAVQLQLVQTQEIQEKTVNVDTAINVIQDNMQYTMDVISTGSKGMEELVMQVEKSVNEGKQAAKDLENLDSYIGQMNSIVEIISNIASQTSLLALNASIEAARAGEAGRGFSVVASEISTMANQTTDATQEITDLIGNVSSAVTSVVEVVKDMIAAINNEKELTENTKKHFNDISVCSDQVNDRVKELIDNVNQLTKANKEISESIQTISAVSEEVSAHSNETFESQSSNSEALKEVMDIADNLKLLTEKIE